MWIALDPKANYIFDWTKIKFVCLKCTIWSSLPIPIYHYRLWDSNFGTIFCWWAPFAPFKASFKDPFKTRPPMGITSFSTIILNSILLHVLKFQNFTKENALLAWSTKVWITLLAKNKCDSWSERLIKKLRLKVGTSVPQILQ